MDGEDYTASYVTTHYDGKIVNFEVSENGVVEVSNDQEKKELLESHGGFKVVDDSEDVPHVLDEKTVDELLDYESRKTGNDAIQAQIDRVNRNTVQDVEFEEVDDEVDEGVEEDEA